MYLTIDLKTTTLETDRLTLRPWTLDDLDDFYAYASVDGVGHSRFRRFAGAGTDSAQAEAFQSEACEDQESR